MRSCAQNRSTSRTFVETAISTTYLDDSNDGDDDDDDDEVGIIAAPLQRSCSGSSCCRAVAGCLAAWVPVTFVYCIETAKDTAIVALECEQETVPN